MNGMKSSLTWLDHDPAARERSQRILALFEEKDSRDELGLGGIRDSIADQLFPGTSTIQTRLRYMLFIPWLYQELENRRVAASVFARRADESERELIDVMRKKRPREDGAFGWISGRALKRLPSSVYWAGLAVWGIRVGNLSREQYHQEIGEIYLRRDNDDARHRELTKIGDDPDVRPGLGTQTWHPGLPPAPPEFPRNATFVLSPDEAEFLLDCIALGSGTKGSLFAHLAQHCEPADVGAPWEHPEFADFPSQHQALLEHARLFSASMHGASLLYNLELSRELGSFERINQYKELVDRWGADVRARELRNWNLPEFWQLTLGKGHSISPATRQFVERWIDLAGAHRNAISDSKIACELVRRREEILKRSRSRFKNRRALDTWGGASGIRPMSYRWSNAKTFLQDLFEGLHPARKH